MRWISEVRERARGLLRREREDAEMDEEMRFHLEMEAERLQREQGLGPQEARRRAAIAFGGVETHREEVRRARGARWIEDVAQDLHYAARSLGRSPAFTSAAVLTLALGIGANTAIFSIVDGVLLRPLPFRDADRLVVVDAGMGVLGEFLTVRERAAALEQVAAYAPREVSLTGEGEPVRLKGASVSAGIFSLLAVDAAAGRGFLPEEGQAGGDRVAVLSHGFWQQRFGSDPAVLGRQIEVDGASRTVVGVMPPEFGFPDAGTQLWIPAVTEPLPPAALWGLTGGYTMIARLRPGTTLERARAEVSALAPQVRASVPWDMPADYWSETRVVPLRDAMVGDVRAMLLVLLGAVGLVLLVACANVANLLLARAAGRRKEIAIRTAIGAGRARIVRQLLTESTLLGLLGGLVGLLLAYGGVAALASILPPDLPRLAEVGIDLRVLAFASALALLTSLVFGSVPALRASRPDLRRMLTEGRGSSGGRQRQRLTNALVTAEIVLAVVLVTGAGLLVQSLWRLLRVDPGFHAENVVAASVAPPPTRYRDEPGRQRLYDELLQRLQALPGARTAAISSGVPFGGDTHGSVFLIEGRPNPATEGGDWPLADARVSVSPAYFHALGIPLLDGRALTDADGATAPGVAVVSRRLAERYWPGEDPIGKRLRLLQDADWRTIVGVVSDVRSSDLKGEGESGLYVPLAQSSTAGPMRVVVRTAEDTRAVVAGIRGIVRTVDEDMPVSDVRTLEQLISASVAQPRSAALLLGIFAVVALALGGVGIYGVTTYAVSHRVREFGLRMALGARASDVLHLVLRQGGGMVAAGIGLGLLAAVAATRVMSSLLYGVSATDPPTFAAVALLLAAVALLAVYLPARRATRVDPMITLRAE